MTTDGKKLLARRRAFTLVELMVLLGVLAVLAAILLPVVDQAAVIAKQLRCANNIRQITAAVFAYASDHGGNLPAAAGIGEMNDSSLAFPMLPANGGAGEIDYSQGQLWKYLDPHGSKANDNALSSSARYQVFNCPADDADTRMTCWEYLGLWPRNFSYSFNMEMRYRPVGGLTGWTTNVRLSDIVNPGQKIITVEEHWPNDGYAVLGWVDETSGNFDTSQPILNRCYADVLTNRHNGLGNQGFGDGHVEAIDGRTLGYDIGMIEFGKSSGAINANDLVCARAVDLFFRH